MSVSKYQIKKWANMLLGKSIHHVNQDEGKIYSIDKVRGYYNNLTEKVTRLNLKDESIPTSRIDSGEEIYFSIEIFQYGLGAYDLFLLNNDTAMLHKSLSCAEWALENQEKNGAWLTFNFDNPDHPYSSMAQGEGISLLMRAYLSSNDDRYFKAASRALQFMLCPIENGGTTKYEGDNVYFYERTGDPLVLNGWVFSYWGLLDFWKVTKDEQAREILDKTLKTMIHDLPSYDTGYWSKYDAGKMICSPFYHKLHIAQLNVMYELTGEIVFKQYADKWISYEKNPFKRNYAFIKKCWQKLREK